MCSGCAGDYENDLCSHSEVRWNPQKQIFECKRCPALLELLELKERDPQVWVKIDG